MAVRARAINWTDLGFEVRIEEFRRYKRSTLTPMAVQPGHTNNYENQ